MRMHEIADCSTYIYAIGCRKRAIERLSVLLTILIAALGLLYYVLTVVSGNFAPFLFVLIVFLSVLHRAMNSHALRMWTIFLTKDSAYGWVRESGIVYRTLFRKGAISWSEIAQLNYCPHTRQIKIYLIYPRFRELPIQFGPPNQTAISSAQKPSLVDFLKQKIESAGGSFVEQRSDQDQTPIYS